MNIGHVKAEVSCRQLSGLKACFIPNQWLGQGLQCNTIRYLADRVLLFDTRVQKSRGLIIKSLNKVPHEGSIGRKEQKRSFVELINYYRVPAYLD